MGVGIANHPGVVGAGDLAAGVEGMAIVSVAGAGVAGAEVTGVAKDPGGV